MVFVISKSGKPLDLCRLEIARLLLKQGKAKSIYRTPFTIRLLYETTEFPHPFTHGLDIGSSTIGSAVVDENNDAVYATEIKVRNDVHKRMVRRASYRKIRRNHKTLYRKECYSNRANSKRDDRISPTVTSKVDSHEKEIKFMQTILPIAKVIVETAHFDTRPMEKPDVLKNKWVYQHGPQYEFANIKSLVLARDHYTCQHCRENSRIRNSMSTMLNSGLLVAQMTHGT
jgi:hypothetical protein